jgi:hypothetical protein
MASNEFRTVSWGAISVTSSSGAPFGNFYTYDGVYQAFLLPDQYNFTFNEAGYVQQTRSIPVSPGENSQNAVYLEQSYIPVPEFSGVAVVAIWALAASVCLLKRRRK